MRQPNLLESVTLSFTKYHTVHIRLVLGPVWKCYTLKVGTLSFTEYAVSRRFLKVLHFESVTLSFTEYHTIGVYKSLWLFVTSSYRLDENIQNPEFVYIWYAYGTYRVTCGISPIFESVTLWKCYTLIHGTYRATCDITPIFESVTLWPNDVVWRKDLLRWTKQQQRQKRSQ